jgi:SM-20-related protein
MLVNSIFDSLADGLAENGYAVADQFLSDQEVKDILNLKEFKNGLSSFKKAGIGKNQDHQINESVRGDYIHWVEKKTAPAPLKVYLDKLAQLVAFLNKTLFLSLKDVEVHLTVYPAGSFYKRHLDQFTRDDHRKISIICYLNENWTEAEGGQLRIFQQKKILEFFPNAGRLICFRSDQVEHEVAAASRPRLSITGWILDQYEGLKHL